LKQNKIYYIHGYLSSTQSRKGELLKEKLNVIPIKYRDCEPENLEISDCLKNIYDTIKNDEEVILIFFWRISLCKSFKNISKY